MALKLFGPDRGWQSRCAKSLGTNRSNVSKWVNGRVIEVPGPVAAAVRCWYKVFKSSGNKP